MGKEYESLPKGVQKLVKKLADVEREQLSVLRAHYPDEEARMMKLIEKGDKVTEELFDTRFALEELGVCYPESPDDLQEMGEYFLGLYALDRAYAEEDGKEYSEDLFYAGANLRRVADVIGDAEMDIDDMEDPDDDDFEPLIDGLIETFGNMPEEKTESNIVNLFGEKKDKQ